MKKWMRKLCGVSLALAVACSMMITLPVFAEGEEDKAQDSLIFSQAAITNSLLDRFKAKSPAEPVRSKVSAKPFMDRLSIISH